MPTYEKATKFARMYDKLSSNQQAQFKKAVKLFVDDLSSGGQFRKSLRVRRFNQIDNVYEMTWAPNGRALWEYGPNVHEGHPHVIWLMIGTHDQLFVDHGQR